MKAPLWLGIVSIMLLAGCSSDSDTSVTQSPPQPDTTQTVRLNPPLVNQSPRAGAVSAVPGLLQPTNPQVRASSVATGRQDPFAALPASAVPMVVSSRGAAPSRASSKIAVAPLPKAPATSPKPLPPVPKASSPTAALPNLGSIPLPPFPTSSSPSQTIAPPSRTALADAIEVSGVVQVGGRWNVIVKEPTASSSRYVAVGDYVENGRVLVKTILTPGGTDPVVVLQQDGVEVRKSLV